MKTKRTRKGVKLAVAHRGRKRTEIIAIAAGAAVLLATVVLLIVFAPQRVEKTPPVTPVTPVVPADPPVEDFSPFVSAPLKAAYEGNPDVIGWLTVEGCAIDDPVAQAQDNDRYLRRTIEREDYDVWGCYFLDYINSVDEDSVSDRVSIIYGHALDDVSESERFSKLKRYKDAAFAAAYPTIRFSLLHETLEWEIFAVSDMPITIDYIDPNPQDAKYAETLAYMRTHSYVDFGVEVGMEDQILVLSTCTSDENVRFVVAARLRAQNGLSAS